MPWRPSSPICGQSSRGNSSVSSIFAAIGAILSSAKRCVVSRIVSAISPRSKSSAASDMSYLLFRPPLAELQVFEQPASRSYVRCNIRLRSTDMATHRRRPDRHPLLRSHADGELPGRACRASPRPSSALQPSKLRSSGRASPASRSTRCSWATCCPAGLGQAPARQAAIGAGLPSSAEAATVNKVCGSGMQAAIFAHDMLAAGSADVIVAGGMESMSNAPYLSKKYRSGARIGHDTIYDHMMLDGLEDAYDKGRAMGTFAEDARRANISSRVSSRTIMRSRAFAARTRRSPTASSTRRSSPVRS